MTIARPRRVSGFLIDEKSAKAISFFHMIRSIPQFIFQPQTVVDRILKIESKKERNCFHFSPFSSGPQTGVL